MRLFFATVGIMLVGSWSSAWADGVDHPANQEEALQKTLQLLTMPNLRAEAIKNSPDAQSVDRQVQAVGGSPAQTEAIYQLSSKIFEDMFKQSKGDSIAMMEMIEKAKKNPEAFAKSLSPENQAQLKLLAGQIKNAPSVDASRQPAGK